MSQENVEIVQRALAAYARGDTEGALELTDPAVVVHAESGLAQAGTYRGRESMARFMRAWEDAWEAMEYEPEEWLDSDEAVVVVVRYRGRGKGSGVTVDDRFAWRYELGDGKIVSWGIYATKTEALEAVGLSE